MQTIKIENACEGNLKGIWLEIPKNKLTVFTGLSGSGKSTLLMDVLFNECQRQYLEAISLEGIHKPKVDRIRGASPSIFIAQGDGNKNPRSTVGTVSDIYTDLRMVYEKLGLRACPFCGCKIKASSCREETEKSGNDFFVYMYCSECGKRMDKITRTYFSHNTKEGACSTCEGLGKIHGVNIEQAVSGELSLEAGALSCFEKQYGAYQMGVFYKALAQYELPVPEFIPVAEYSQLQKAFLYEGTDGESVKKAFPGMKPRKSVTKGKFEGVIPILYRRLAEKKGEMKQLDRFFDTVDCPDCKGERLCESSRSVTVEGIRLPQLAGYSLEKLLLWVDTLSETLPEKEEELVRAYLRAIKTKLGRFIMTGLSYLSLDRQTITLSGGELQRLRLAAALSSELSGVIYILDEPTIGLHPRDTKGLIVILQKLRDLDNTVLVIEHDLEVMAAADHIVDIGPGAGKWGGQVVAEGSIQDIQKAEASVTGRYLLNKKKETGRCRPIGETAVHIEHADKHNLQDIAADIPAGCLTAVVGPSGSGKSTLIFEVLAKGERRGANNLVSWRMPIDQTVVVRQSAINRMKRSNVATYSDAYAEIRSLFAKTEGAKQAGFRAAHFSFNTPGGRCENCQGLGVIDSNMLFFTNIEVVCPVCGGNRFHEDILSVKYRGLSIPDVLMLSIEEAVSLFADQKKLSRILQLLLDVGLGYLELGQTLTTLSGGEGQRLKLAKELIGSGAGKHTLYLMDEPTIGLHPKDVEHFLELIQRLVDAGNTVVVVEHNEQFIEQCDHIIALGPEGGERGGRIVFTGTPQEFASV